MPRPIKALVAVDAGVDRDLLDQSLPVQSDVQIVGIVHGLEDAWATLQETPADLLVVACAGYSDRALYLVDGAVKQRPNRPVVVLVEASPNGFVTRAFEAGADDVVVLPDTPDRLAFSLRKAMARKAGAAGASGVAQASLICVLGPKGGTGKTLTSTNVAVSLAQRGENVVLVDLDLQFGDVGLCLGLTPTATIYDLVKAGTSLDADKVAAYLVAHESGLRVLLAPTRPDQAAAITVEFLRELYPILRSLADYVVVDTPPGFTPEVIATIDMSTDVCMVGMLDSLSLKNTKLGLETLELMGYSDERIRLILNRAHSRVGITTEDVLAIVGRQPDALVPSDREIPRSTTEGTPIVLAKSNSEAAAAFQKLAESLVRSETSGSNGKPDRSLRRLLKRGA
jgi:pilus assembly protein CpaE